MEVINILIIVFAGHFVRISTVVVEIDVVA
jgi:hypothetical protein